MRTRSLVERARGRAGAALAILLAGGLAYSNSFVVPFLYDDLVVLVGEPAITGFHLNPASRRFLGDLSFAVSYRLFGEHTAGYHAVNLAIHLANALLVRWLVLLLFRTEALRRSPRASLAPRIALLSALLFVAHPLQTQAVTYIVQRYASLAAAFFLLSVCAYVRFRLSASGWRARGWYALFLAGAGAALWTKENAFVLPLVVVGVELVFFSGPLRRRLLLFSPFLAAALGLAALAAGSGMTLERLDALTRVATDMPRADYFLTQLRVVASYLRLLLLPFGQNVDHDVRLSRSLLEGPVLLAASLHLALLGVATWALVRGFRGDARSRLVGFGIAWFYAALLVESSFIPIVDVMFEHRVYLPSVGLVLCAATLLAGTLALARSRAFAAACAVLVVALAGLTLARNRVWRSDLALWADAAEKSPDKPRPLNNLGIALLERGDTVGAIDRFRRAIRSDPSYAKAYFNLGEALQKQGACAEAIPAYRVFLVAYPDYPDTYRNLADCYAQAGDRDAARAYRELHQRVLAATAGAALPVHLR